MSYAAARAAIDRLERFGIRLGLDNMRAVCEAVVHPERAFPSIHVGGTNGKGTTAALLAGLARAHGLRTGLYTSPHLVDLRERIRIDGRPIPATELAAIWDRIAGHVEARRMTYFEATTLIAFEHFARAGVDLAVLEVGLGGRLDATNVAVPMIAIVTGVDHDHERWLGPDLSGIAREKAGIFKPGTPALVGDPGPLEVRATFASVAGAVGAPLGFLPDEARWSVRSVEPGRTRLDYASRALGLEDLELPLTGASFAEAAALALRAWERLAAARRVPVLVESRAREAWAALALGGRGEWRMLRGVPHLLDVAHNPAACTRLAATVREAGLGAAALVFGALADKAWPRMLDALAPAAARVWVCDLATAGARRLAREDAASELARHGAVWAGRVAEALAAARATVERGEASFVLVSGSFHTVGEALLALGLAEPGEPYEPAGRGVALAEVAP